MEHQLQEKEIKALVSLISDEDEEVQNHIREKIISFGAVIIPYLEHEWENSLEPKIQKRIEEIIHQLQFEHLRRSLLNWYLYNSENLLEGLWLVATYQYPDLEIEKLKKQIEQLYYEVWIEMRADLHPFDQIKILNEVIFKRQHFSSNIKNFHAPGNSMINVVLESKKGSPISLCVLYMIIAQKLKLPVFGVNLPNLFVLTYKTEERQFYINVFNKGLILSRTDIETYLANLNLSPLDIFFEPCSHLDIVRRILRNLIVSFDKIGDPDKVEEVKELLRTISEEDDDSNLF
jgi:regulator of sirC expression with transglutaminase-like and TPR domain